MNVREAIVAALKGDPDFLPKVKERLRARVEEEEGALTTVVQAAEVLEPIIADAVMRRPSRLGQFGLKSAQVLASLASRDQQSNARLARIARGSIVGIVFVDVAGFTTFTARNGDPAAIDLLARLQMLVNNALRPSKGECVKRLGDGFLLAFPSGSQAVRAAVFLRESAERHRRSGDFPLYLRIAVHAGEPLVEDDDLLGHDVNLAARLLEHCKPGDVVVSEAVKDSAGSRLKSISFVRRRSVRIRGLASRVVIYNADRSDERSLAT